MTRKIHRLALQDVEVEKKKGGYKIARHLNEFFILVF